MTDRQTDRPQRDLFKSEKRARPRDDREESIKGLVSSSNDDDDDDPGCDTSTELHSRRRGVRVCLSKRPSKCILFLLLLAIVAAVGLSCSPWLWIIWRMMTATFRTPLPVVVVLVVVVDCRLIEDWMGDWMRFERGIYKQINCENSCWPNGISSCPIFLSSYLPLPIIPIKIAMVWNVQVVLLARIHSTIRPSHPPGSDLN